MNQPPESYVIVKEDELISFTTCCFERVGLSSDHAHLIARFLVNSDLRGVRSHGTRTINGYCSAFENMSLNPAPKIETITQSPTTMVLDGDGTLGYLPMAQATEFAIKKAKELGLGMGLVRGIGHYGSAGHYTRLCSESGCVGFSVQGYHNQGDSSSNQVKPQLGYFGNPPISFAISGQDEPPIILDAATCIMADYQRGETYDQLLSLIPAAFFKSIGYTAVASLLGGGLTGFTLPESEETRKRWPAARMGGMILAIHIDTVVPESVFKKEVDRMVRDVKNTYEPLPGTEQALLPGAIEEDRFSFHQQNGIRYGEMEQEGIRLVSQRLDVPIPWNE
ncbi:hypothetical protein CMK15_05445 [Candidatus Poribacteria bacterium]|nr:hypothetical protein [Candidatus Poribacteria bacterium]